MTLNVSFNAKESEMFSHFISRTSKGCLLSQGKLEFQKVLQGQFEADQDGLNSIFVYWLLKTMVQKETSLKENRSVF